jgi:hypothetical protein
MEPRRRIARAATNVERKSQAREWDEQHGKLIDLSAFQRDILPMIQGLPLSRLQKATGLSLRYVSLIRRGQRTPHLLHRRAFVDAAEPKVCRNARLQRLVHDVRRTCVERGPALWWCGQ